MKQFKFEITLTEDDLKGDEFWEEAIERDGTGIAELIETIQKIVKESFIVFNH